MKPTVIRLIELGMDSDFGLSMNMAQDLVASLTARSWSGEGQPVAEVELVRTRDVSVVQSALQAPATVVHITGHGDTTPDSMGFWSDDWTSSHSLTELAEHFAEARQGIEAGTVFADCCGTAQGRFVKAVRDCIEGPVAYIGAKRMIDWYEGSTFASSFYAALMRNRGKGVTPHDRGFDAAQRAVRAYEELVGKVCPYSVKMLEPSRRAKKLLGAWCARPLTPLAASFQALDSLLAEE